MIANVKMPRLCAKCYQCCKCHGPWQKYHKCHGSEQNANTAMVLGNDATNATNLSTMLPIPRPFTKYYKCHGSKQNATSLLSCLKRRIDVTRQVMSTFLFFFCFFLNGFCGAGIGINFRTSPEPHQ